jgi:prepilin-type N-terminal cleavage/methylation domain-containing protein
MEKNKVMLLMKRDGFTLIELIVVIVIILTLLAISYGGFKALNSKYMLKNYANQLSSDINFARNKSKELGERIVFVVADTNRGGQSWITGEKPLNYFAFIDKDKDFGYTSSVDEVLLIGENKGGVLIDNNTIPNNCISNGKCFLIFPVSMPLIGPVDFKIILKNSAINTKYNIIIRAYTGISYVKKE